MKFDGAGRGESLFKRALPAAALVAACCAPAYARQEGGPMAVPSIGKVMERRMEMSARSVDETLRRRFEEGKLSSTYPTDAAKARAGTMRAVSPEERKALALNEKGISYFAKNKHDDAIKQYREAIRIYPNLAAAHNNLGSAQFALGSYKEAAESFARAAQIDAAYGEAFFNLALAYIKLGSEKEANDALVAATRAYLTAGDEQFDSGEHKEAEASFKAVLRIDPGYLPAHFRLGLVYNAAQRFEEAAESFRLVLRSQPKIAEVHENLAEALYGLRKYEEAADAAGRAIALRPAEPGAYYIAGMAHASLGRREQALASLEKLRELKADKLAAALQNFVEKKK